MLTRLGALIVLCTVLGVFGDESTMLATYTRDLQQEPVLGHTIGITDGDTIRVLTADKQQIRGRIAFIDAPERGQAFGQRAKQAMSELVFGKDVELHPHTVDRYGRLVARSPCRWPGCAPRTYPADQPDSEDSGEIVG